MNAAVSLPPEPLSPIEAFYAVKRAMSAARDERSIKLRTAGRAECGLCGGMGALVFNGCAIVRCNGCDGKGSFVLQRPGAVHIEMLTPPPPAFGAGASIVGPGGGTAAEEMSS